MQLLYQCMIVGAPHGHLVVFDADGEGRFADRFIVLEYERDLELEQLVTKRLTEFWEEYVLKGVPPPRGW